MNSADRANRIAAAIVTLAVKLQQEPGEGLAALCMAVAGAMLSGNMSREAQHRMLDAAIDCVKPSLAVRGMSLAVRGVLPS